jgi:hypothetical protein
VHGRTVNGSAMVFRAAVLLLVLAATALRAPSAAWGEPRVEFKQVCNQPPPMGDPAKRWWGFSDKLLGGPPRTWVVSRQELTGRNPTASGGWTDDNGDGGESSMIAGAPLGTVTVTFWAEDPRAGNMIQDPGEPTIARGTLVGICEDQTPPQVVVTSPPEGAVYAPHELVRVHYGCGDEPGGSGLAACAGAVPDGGALDTTRLGEQVFVVTATDNAGNKTVARVRYTIAAPEAAPPAQPPAASAATPVPSAPSPSRQSARPAPTRISPVWTIDFKRRGAATRITRLKLSRLPAHTRVELDCTGRSCRTHRIALRPGADVDLARPISGWWLHGGTILEVRATMPQAVGFYLRVRIRAGDRPAATARCLSPGKRRPQRRCRAA